jgi:hypothetical protein
MISQEWLSQSRAAAEAQRQAIATKLSKYKCDIESSGNELECGYGISDANITDILIETPENRGPHQDNGRSIPTNHHKRRHSNMAGPANPESDASAQSSTPSTLDRAAGPDEAELSHDETHDPNRSVADFERTPSPDTPPFLERAHCALRALLSGAAPPGGRARPAQQAVPPRRCAPAAAARPGDSAPRAAAGPRARAPGASKEGRAR